MDPPGAFVGRSAFARGPLVELGFFAPLEHLGVLGLPGLAVLGEGLDLRGLAAFKQKHLGRGWVERFPGSKGMRDSQGVKIDVLLTGDYPGDGLPKPVRFPDPIVAVVGDGFRVLPIPRLVELKLASGMSNPDRLKDLADVQELVRHARLPRTLGDELDASVRGRYLEIWDATRRRDEDDDDL